MSCREELLFMVHSNNTDYTWNPIYLEEECKRNDLGANGKPRKTKNKRCSDVWYDITEASQSSKQRFKLRNGIIFPTVKNIKLCNRIIQASSNTDDLILIPFAGSGSEIISCIDNNRNFIACERNIDYIDDIILDQRLKPRNIKFIKEKNYINLIL